MMPNEGRTVYQNMVIFLFRPLIISLKEGIPSRGSVHDHFRGRQVQGRRQHIHPVQPRERLQPRGLSCMISCSTLSSMTSWEDFCHFLPERRHRRVRLRVRIL